MPSVYKKLTEKKHDETLFGAKRSNLNLSQKDALQMLDLDFDNYEFVVKQGRKDDVSSISKVWIKLWFDEYISNPFFAPKFK